MGTILNNNIFFFVFLLFWIVSKTDYVNTSNDNEEYMKALEYYFRALEKLVLTTSF